MPRDVQAFTEDGQDITIKGIPDNVTPEQLSDKIAKDYGSPVTELKQLNQRTSAAIPQAGVEPARLWETTKEAGRVIDRSVRGGAFGLPGLLGDGYLAGLRALVKPGSPVKDTFSGSPLGLAMPFAGVAAQAFSSDNPVTRAIGKTKFGDVAHALQTFGGLVPESKPETELGRAAANVGESVVGTMLSGGPLSLPRKAVIGASAGVGGEVAERAFPGTPLSRIIGSVLGSFGGTALTKLRPNAPELIKETTAGMTAQDWRRAHASGKVAVDEKIDTLASQHLGPRSMLKDVVGVAATNPTAGSQLRTAVSKSQDQAEAAFQRFSSKNLPLDINERSAVLNEVQGTAAGAIDKLKQVRTQAWESAYDKELAKLQAKNPLMGLGAGEAQKTAAENLTKAQAALKQAMELPPITGGSVATSGAAPAVSLEVAQAGVRQAQEAAKKAGVLVSMADATKVPQTVIQKVYENLGLLASKTPNTTQSAKLLELQGKLKLDPENFITDGKQLNAILKDFQGGLNRVNLQTSGHDAGQAKYLGSVVDNVRKDLGEAFSPIRAANEVYKNLTNSTVNPAKKSLVGQIAELGGGPRADKVTAKDSVLDLVFPKNKGHPVAIEELASHIGGDAVGQLLREHLSRAMSSAATRAADGKGPLNFTYAVAGTKDQIKNLEAALKVTAEASGANPYAVRNGFYKLMKVFDTTKNLDVIGGIDKASLNQKAGFNLPGLLGAPASTFRRFTWETASADTYQKLAAIVTSKDGLRQLEAIAKTPDQKRIQSMAAAILLSSQAGDNSRTPVDKPAEGN